MTAPRLRLPNRRAATTFNIDAAGLRFVATVGRFDNGEIAEIFIGSNRTGSAADSLARDAAITFSIAVQHGADPETIRRALCRDGQGLAMGPLGVVLDKLVAQT
jgi:ribonucleoside-diphosphate reductase alpha chain